LGEGKLKELRRYFSLLRGNLLIIIVTWAFIEFARGATSTYYSKYVVGLGAPEMVPGLLQALYTSVYAIVAIIGGYVADRYGRKNIIAFFTFFVAFSYLLYATAPAWQWLIIAETTLALTSIYIPALQAMIADSIPPEKRGKGYSLTYLITYLAAAPSALVAGILVALREFLKDTLPSYKYAVKSMKESLVWLITAYIIFTFSFAACSKYWILYTVDEMGITDEQWALISFASSITYPLVIFPAGFIVDKIGRKKSWILSRILFAAATIIYLLTPKITTITISLPTSTLTLQKYHILITDFVIFALALGILGVAVSALQADLIPRELRGRTMAAISLLTSFLAIVPGNIYGGYTYQYLSKTTPFITLLILNIISLTIIILKVKEPKIKEK